MKKAILPCIQMLYLIPISLRLAIVFILATLLPMGIFGYLSITHNIEKIKLDQQTTLQNRADALATQLQTVFNQYQILTQAMAYDADIVAYAQSINVLQKNTSTTASQALHDLQKLHQSIPQIQQISIISDQSIVKLSSVPEPSLSKHNEVNKTLLTRSKATLLSNQNLFIANPILSSKQQYLAMLLIEVDAKVLYQLIKRDATNTPDSTIELQQSDTVLYTIDAPATSVTSTIEPSSLIKAQANIANTDLHITLTQSDDVVTQPIQQLLLSNGIVFLLCLLSSIAATWLISRRLTHPIQLLIHKSRELQQGRYSNADLDEPLHLLANRQDEMGKFIAVYKQMITDIHQREEVLESLVSERTSELFQSNQLLALNQQRLNQELQLAHDMQQALLPQRFPRSNQFNLYAAMNPAQEMGGDFYDCFELENGHYALLVADVAGKGIASAFFMAISSTLIKQASAKHIEPHLVLKLANEWLCQRNPQNLFVTVFYAVFNPATLMLQYANAGHHSGLLLSESDKIQALESPPQLPLGAWEGIEYSSHHVTLNPNDCVVLYTDGITEALSQTEQEYGEERLHNLLHVAKKHRNAQTIFQALKNDVGHFVGTAQAHDDMTVLILKIAPTPKNQTHEQSWSIKTVLSEVDAINVAITAYLNGLLPEQAAAIFDVSVCLEELLSNLVNHGLLTENAVIQINIAIYPDAIRCQLQDTAEPFNPFIDHYTSGQNLIEQPLGGLGLHLVAQLADEYDYQTLGGINTTEFIKYLNLGQKPTHDI